MEINETLSRNELTVMERGEFFKRRKEIYEAKYPETRKRGAGASAFRSWGDAIEFSFCRARLQ
jgi:hypothetical protein